MDYGNVLFAGEDLRSHLDQKKSALRRAVEQCMDARSPDGSDDRLIDKIFGESVVEPVSIDFESVDKDVQPAKVMVIDFGRRIEIDGVQVTYTYSFIGDSRLFRFQPSTYSSSPYGIVSADSVTIGITDRNDPEEIKREMARQEEMLRKYVEWQRSDIEEYNSKLKTYIAELVQNRREHLDGIERLKSQL